MIYCLGDSHVSFFSGRDRIQPGVPEFSDDLLPFFRTFHIGPALAYNLVDEGTLTRGREKILDILQTQVPSGSRVLLCFGEIDCRAHLLRQVWKQNSSVEAIARDCAERYLRFATEVRDQGFEVTIYNAIPSRRENTRRDKWDKASYPAVGTMTQRNEMTKVFNRNCEELCRPGNIHFLGNYFDLVTASGKTREEFYMDRIHLSQRAMPLTLAHLAKIYPEENLLLPPEWSAPKLHRVFSFRWPFTWLETHRKERS